MRILQEEVLTSATPAAVHAVWSDVATWPAWDVEVREARLEGPFVLGARGTLVPARGRPSSFVVAELDAPGHHLLDVGLPLARLRLRRTVRSTPAGTLVRHEVAFTGPLGPLFALLLGRRFARALPGALDGLRRAAERHTPEG